MAVHTVAPVLPPATAFKAALAALNVQPGDVVNVSGEWGPQTVTAYNPGFPLVINAANAVFHRMTLGAGVGNLVFNDLKISAVAPNGTSLSIIDGASDLTFHRPVINSTTELRGVKIQPGQTAGTPASQMPVSSWCQRIRFYGEHVGEVFGSHGDLFAIYGGVDIVVDGMLLHDIDWANVVAGDHPDGIQVTDLVGGDLVENWIWNGGVGTPPQPTPPSQAIILSTAVGGTQHIERVKVRGNRVGMEVPGVAAGSGWQGTPVVVSSLNGTGGIVDVQVYGNEAANVSAAQCLVLGSPGTDVTEWSNVKTG